MVNLNDVTMISVDGTGTNKDITKAMQISKRHLDFADNILLSPSTNYSDTEDIDIVKIDAMTYDDWNKFMINEIDKYFNSSHYLFVDTDGFVINPLLWDDSFLEYDYIGAPWDYNTHIMSSPVVDEAIKQKDEVNTNLVGNGGFALRSKKLTGLTPLCPDARYVPEDVFICINNYDFFNERGIKYAPVEVAKRFSQDPLLNKKNSFGFHGNKTYINEVR